MRFSTARNGVSVILLVAMSACSAQEESLGTVTADIGGNPYQGITLEGPDDGSASADFTVIGGMTMVAIQAHDTETASIMDNVLNLSLSLMGSDASATLLEVTLSYWPEGMSGAFYTSEETDNSVDIEWQTLSLGDDAFAQGSFSADLCRKESYFTEIDMSDCVAVEGTFETALRQSEI